MRYSTEALEALTLSINNQITVEQQNGVSPSNRTNSPDTRKIYKRSQKMIETHGS